MSVQRNYFGSQQASFICSLPTMPGLRHPHQEFPGVFIRAPVVSHVHHPSANSGVEILQRLPTRENEIVAVQQNHHYLATAFHPELTDDLRYHDYFLRTFVLPNG